MHFYGEMLCMSGRWGLPGEQLSAPAHKDDLQH